MTTPLNLPFVRANTWDVRQTRVNRSNDNSQVNRAFENRGELAAPIFYYGINYDSQLNPSIPLNHPYDSPAYRDCAQGPIHCAVNGNFCTTNVVSRLVHHPQNDREVLETAPTCHDGYTPTIVGMGPSNGPTRVQWQCLPSSSVN